MPLIIDVANTVKNVIAIQSFTPEKSVDKAYGADKLNVPGNKKYLLLIPCTKAISSL